MSVKQYILYSNNSFCPYGKGKEKWSSAWSYPLWGNIQIPEIRLLLDWT